MERNDVEIGHRETVFRGCFKVDRYRLRHRLFEGGWSPPLVREVFERGHAVAVIPYDPVLDRLVLIEQFRIGPLAAALTSPWFSADLSPWLLEIVAGIIDEGESPEDVARRETREEAGCHVSELIPVCHVFASPGALTESVRIYCGRVDASEAGGIHGIDHEHEDIRVLTVAADEAFRWLDEGRFVNITALAALQWFRINHGSVRASWCASRP